MLHLPDRITGPADVALCGARMGVSEEMTDVEREATCELCRLMAESRCRVCGARLPHELRGRGRLIHPACERRRSRR
jgi:hypothetical protein